MKSPRLRHGRYGGHKVIPVEVVPRKADYHFSTSSYGNNLV